MRSVGALTIAVVVVTLLASCTASPKGVATGEGPGAAEPVDKVAVPEPIPVAVWPLTGVATDEVAPRPALSIKIENSSQARPQTGLEQADIVWEEMVEGGITRFNAVFHSSIPATVGPIRSLRPMDADISGPLGGLFVASGGQRQFYNEVAKTGLTMLTHDGGASGFYRNQDRVAPHNVFGEPEVFLEQGGDQGPPPPQFSWGRDLDEATAMTGAIAQNIRLTFPAASPGWQWDGQSYLREEGSDPAETTDGGQIEAVNIIVLRVEITYSGATDPAGSPVPETVLTGTGEALVAAGGHYVEATWAKTDATGALQLTGPDGAAVVLAPGNTWVELVPVNGSQVSIS
ncbi:MAG: DUF3048 domain-containing protein [Beutenbergiaceae bacterium]